MARMPRLCAALFFALILIPFASERPATIAAQSGVTIAGSVVDALLKPLAGVSLSLEQGGRAVATTTTDADGKFTFAAVTPGDYRVRVQHTGFPAFSRDVRVPANVTRIQMPIVLTTPADAIARATENAHEESALANPAAAPVPSPFPPPPGQTRAVAGNAASVGRGSAIQRQEMYGGWQPPSTARYAQLPQNDFNATRDEPLSTFGADVDTASYANVRRFLSMGQLPPTGAVRVEEFVNYFRFEYPEPTDGRPIALTTETADCPWAPTHKLVLIGAKATTKADREVTGRNLVLLIDVSGSMGPAERLPLIKTALAQFVDTLAPDDRIALVTYAGSSGLALPSTPARERVKIQNAIARLGAGGSTNGASGITLAYRIARESYIPGGVNRVILATDGDFNVGVTSQRDLIQLIERERDSGVFLSVFGVGGDNLNDAMMEQLADRGNGNYSYLDSLQEARRVLVREGGSTLETIAKDVKFQVEFNPAEVAAWKLIGYENRHLAAKDFNDDRKDAGEMGAGHTVTVLYEVVPVGSPDAVNGRVPGAVDPLRYGPAAPQQSQPRSIVTAATAGEWLTVKVRYKAPDDDRSELISQPVRASARVQHLPFAAAIAEFGLLLIDNARNDRAWEALSRRVSALEVPRGLIADKAGFEELVGIAAGISRRR